MAFKLTPGIKGNPANSSMMNGGCGGDGQPPCPPRFQAEKTMAPVAERSSRSKAIRAKKKVAPPKQAPIPVKLVLNLPKGYEFLSKFQKDSFYDFFSDLSSYKTQEALDNAVIKRLKAGPIGLPGPQLPQLPELPGKDVPAEIPAPIQRPVPVEGVGALKPKAAVKAK